MPLTRKVDLRNLNRVKRPATTTNLDPITYNDRYPGLDEYNYNKLSSKIDSLGLSGYDREKAMDEAYIQVLPLVQNDIKNSDRRKYINQAKYDVSQIQDPTQQKQANMKLSTVELAQLVKEKYNVDPTANDEAVFNSWMGTIPNGEQLLVNYLNNGDKELLYKGGLEKDPKEGKQKLRDNFWDSLWDNIKTKANIPVDNFKKRGKRTFNEASEKIYKNMLKNTLGDSVLGKMGINLDNYVDTVTDKTLSPALQQDTLNYQNQINERYQALEQKNMDQDIKNYYDNKGYTKLLGEGDFKGFLYKSMGDAAQNREMPAVIAASVFQPEIGMALMTTDSYARENQEAFENMMNNGATYEQAEQGAVAVGLVNAAVEVTLEKLLGGVETSASSAIRKTLMKNVQEEAAKKGLGRILLEGAGTQLRSSTEEGLEEIIQQIVQNAAVKTVNENQKLFEGVGQAFEGGFYNPLNLLAGGGNINQNINQNKDVIREQIMEGAYNAGQTARNITDKVGITKDGTTNTQGDMNIEGTEITTANPTTQGDMVAVDNTVTDMDNGAIELIDEETSAENNTNTDLAETQGGSKFWEAVSGLEDNIKEKIKRNPYAIEESRELIKNMEDNPGLDFTEYQNERYESVLDMIEERLKQAEDKRKNDVGGLYTKLEEANAPIDTTNLKNRVAEYQARVEELGDILSSSDKAKIETILKNIQEIGDGTMDIWKVRKIADQWAKYDQGATGDGIRLIRDIRNAIDDEIMAQNPEMKEVDQAYKKAKDEIQDLRGNLTYKKTGEIKSNAVSTVKNMLNANNKKYLSTLEKYIPGITERLQAIRDSKLVYNAYTSGEGSRFVSKGRDFVTKGILAGGGYLLGGPVGAGIGYLISGKVDEAITSLARKGLKETITKETAESIAELERINKKIEENQRLEAEEKAKLRELGDRIMQKMATMDKTDAEQAAWNNWLVDLEQDEVIDMPEEVYDQWEEVTTTPKKKTTLSESQAKLEIMKQHSKEENIRAYKGIQDRLAKEKDVLDNYDNYVKVGYIQNKSDPRWQYHEDSYKAAVEREKTRRSNMDKLYGDWLDEQETKKTTKKETSKKVLDKNQASSKTATDTEYVNETPQDIDYEELAELENETPQRDVRFEEDIEEENLKELEENENETPSGWLEEFETKSEIETLPADVSIEKEAKETGPKRIAPDRVPRQQLTFDEGVNKINNNLKTVAEYMKLRSEFYTAGNYNDSEMKHRLNTLEKEVQQILYGKNGFNFQSTRSKEFNELWKNITDNKNNPAALREVAKTFYISKVKKDISKGYQFPIEVLEKIPGAKKALDARERYQKGLDTSFSAKDARIDYSEKDKIGGGIKSQDGKQVTKEQKDNIVKGILDFQDVFGIDVKKIAEDKGIVFVDLHGGNAFLSQAAGLYREATKQEGGDKNVSVSVGGSETIRWKDNQTKEWKTEKVNTTMSHELGHAMDYLVDKKLLDRSDYLDLYQKYKKPQNRRSGFAKYLERPTEVTARAFEEYMDVAKGGDTYYDRLGYWNKEDFEYIVKPILEEAIEKKLSEWRLKKS